MGYYQIEYETPEMTTKVLAWSPLALRAARAHFCSWTHGFRTATDPLVEAAGFSMSAVFFPGLKKDYRPLLRGIGITSDDVLQTPQTVASVVTRAVGLPSVRVTILDISDLLKDISLPLFGGGWITQRVEYLRLPNQCFICRGEGHLARVSLTSCTSVRGRTSTWDNPARRGQVATSFSRAVWRTEASPAHL